MFFSSSFFDHLFDDKFSAIELPVYNPFPVNMYQLPYMWPVMYDMFVYPLNRVLAHLGLLSSWQYSSSAYQSTAQSPPGRSRRCAKIALCAVPADKTVSQWYYDGDGDGDGDGDFHHGLLLASILMVRRFSLNCPTFDVPVVSTLRVLWNIRFFQSVWKYLLTNHVDNSKH